MAVFELLMCFSTTAFEILEKLLICVWNMVRELGKLLMYLKWGSQCDVAACCGSFKI